MTSKFKNLIASHNTFKGQEEGETVVMVVRRHPFPVIVNIIFFAFLGMIPLIVGVVFSNFLNSNDLFVIFLFLTSLWYLLLWSGLFYALTMYILDVWIITDRRIVDSTQHGFFNRVISELHMSRIQDISVSTAGIIPTFLKFGDLQVQTAGNEEKFNFSQIPHPERVKDTIMDIVGNRSHP
jgi:uncharacterized membrane protein YdbT with pleckstrin-like domain